MKITSVSSDCYRVPVRVPLKDEPIHHECLLVRVETDEGITGHGLSGPVLPRAAAEFVNKEAAPWLTGQDPMNTARIWQGLFQGFNVRTLSGAWSSGVSGIDIALWDIKGKVLGQPVYRLLGGARDRVPAYITFGLAAYSQEELVEVAKMLADEGHDKLKMVVGVIGSVKEDAARVRAVREAVGDDVELMIDANYLLSYPEALELCRRVEDCNLSWFEEPLYGNDYRLLAQLKGATSIPLAAGQNFGNVWQHRELIIHGAIDYSQPNVCYVGGYTEAAQVASLARAFNLPVANGGGWPHHNLHLQAGVPNGVRVEFHFLMWMVGNELFEGTPQPQDGWADLPTEPGLGFEPRAEVLEQFRLD